MCIMMLEELNIMHIGEYLKKIRHDKEMTQGQLAVKTGLSKSAISLIERGERMPELDTLSQLAKALNIDLSLLISMRQGKPSETYTKDDFYRIEKVADIPIVGTVRAGRPILAIDNIEGYISIDRMMLTTGKEYYGLRVKGDSMDRMIADGSIAVIEKTEVIMDGDVAVVGINGDEATIKKIQFKHGGIILYPMSNNPNYEPKYYHMVEDDVHILGKLVYEIKKF